MDECGLFFKAENTLIIHEHSGRYINYIILNQKFLAKHHYNVDIKPFLFATIWFAELTTSKPSETAKDLCSHLMKANILKV